MYCTQTVNGTNCGLVWRRINKRILPEERYNINEALYGFDRVFNGNNKVAMRSHLVDKLADACGRRGEDLREVSFSFLWCDSLFVRKEI